jgi:hypothetical protein
MRWVGVIGFQYKSQDPESWLLIFGGRGKIAKLSIAAKAVEKARRANSGVSNILLNQ